MENEEEKSGTQFDYASATKDEERVVVENDWIGGQVNGVVGLHEASISTVLYIS